MNEILIGLLEEMYDEFSNHGCNDYYLDNTLENYNIVEDMISRSDYPDDKVRVTKDNKILLPDFELIQYCIEVLREK